MDQIFLLSMLTSNAPSADGEIRAVTNWKLRYAKEDPKKAVFEQLEEDYPEDAMDWINDDADWSGPEEIPLNEVDYSNRKSWRAWHEKSKVKSKIRKIQNGRKKPVVLVKTPKDDKYIIIDGHHRALAYRKLDMPVTAWVGEVKKEKGPWDEFHAKQILVDGKDSNG